MRSVAILAHHADRLSRSRIAAELAGVSVPDNKEGGLEVLSEAWWQVGGLRRRAASAVLARADCAVVLWSRQSARDARWLPRLAFDLAADSRLLSVKIEPCHPPAPFGEDQAFDLSEPATREGQFWQLVRALAESLKLAALANLASYRIGRFQRRSEERGMLRERRLWTYRDLLDLCVKLAPQVSKFRPDVLLAFDARGGIWAQILAGLMQHDTPVVTGFRLWHTGPRKTSALFDGCRTLHAGRWHLLLPPALLGLPREKRILIVDDYTETGATCSLTKRYLVASGWPEESIKTLALVISPLTKERPDWSGVISDAKTNDLFYMYQR